MQALGGSAAKPPDPPGVGYQHLDVIAVYQNPQCWRVCRRVEHFVGTSKVSLLQVRHTAYRFEIIYGRAARLLSRLRNERGVQVGGQVAFGELQKRIVGVRAGGLPE